MPVDYFGNRYWTEKYFPTGYFQGGEALPEGSISAALHGAGGVTATLSVVSVVRPEPEMAGSWRRTKYRPKAPATAPVAIPAFAAAAIAASGVLTATGQRVAVAASRLNGKSHVIATAEAIDRYALEAEFWLIAA